MAKKKKKKAQVSAKLIKAQKLKDFKKRLSLMAMACGAHEEFKLIPKDEIAILHASNFRPFDIIAANGQELAPNNYKILKQMVTYFLKDKTIRLIPNGAEISLYEYFYIGEALITCVRAIKEEKFKGLK